MGIGCRHGERGGDSGWEGRGGGELRRWWWQAERRRRRCWQRARAESLTVAVGLDTSYRDKCITYRTSSEYTLGRDRSSTFRQPRKQTAFPSFLAPLFRFVSSRLVSSRFVSFHFVPFETSFFSPLLNSRFPERFPGASRFDRGCWLSLGQLTLPRQGSTRIRA